MTLTILNVAYPFAPVGPDATGGAEQVVSGLDRFLVQSGHRSIVIACDGSQVAGTHIGIPRPPGALQKGDIDAAHRRCRDAIAQALGRWPVDVVHLHGIDFSAYLPPPDIPSLATLHLPVSWYSPAALHLQRDQLWFNCVSHHQRATLAPHPRLLATIENGVSERFFTSRHAKRNFTLMLTRICPEKGVHIAIDAAKRAGVPLLIAGHVFPHQAHQRYFAEMVAPRLDRWRRFIGPVGLSRKRRLLATARCILIPSLVDETASLAAREALACGTPVIAFARGALTETVDDRKTGFLVRDVEQMAEAIARASDIDPAECRRSARERFSLHRMMEQYVALYKTLTFARGRQLCLGAA